MFTCCQEDRRLVTAPCGRSYSVCQSCDNGINDCTEGHCGHEPITDRPMDEPCQKGTVGCCLNHTRDGECEGW